MQKICMTLLINLNIFISYDKFFQVFHVSFTIVHTMQRHYLHNIEHYRFIGLSHFSRLRY